MSESAGILPPSSSRPAGPSGPVGAVRAVVDHVPGSGLVKGAANGVLDVVGSVSPQARRIAVYAGVGVLGAVGIVEWPVAAVGAAAVWLTQQRPRNGGGTGAPPADERQAPATADAAPKRTKGTARAKPGEARSGRSGAAAADAAPPPDRTAG
ncbi:hypothetical protein [Streptomyces sp. NPDC002537]